MSCRSVGSKRHVFLRKKSILASFFLHITIKHKKNCPKAVIKRSVFYRKIFLKSFPCPYLPPTILVPSSYFVRVDSSRVGEKQEVGSKK